MRESGPGPEESGEHEPVTSAELEPLVLGEPETPVEKVEGNYNVRETIERGADGSYRKRLLILDGPKAGREREHVYDVNRDLPLDLSGVPHTADVTIAHFGDILAVGAKTDEKGPGKGWAEGRWNGASLADSLRAYLGQEDSPDGQPLWTTNEARSSNDPRTGQRTITETRTLEGGHRLVRQRIIGEGLANHGREYGWIEVPASIAVGQGDRQSVYDLALELGVVTKQGAPGQHNEPAGSTFLQGKAKRRTPETPNRMA